MRVGFLGERQPKTNARQHRSEARVTVVSNSKLAKPCSSENMLAVMLAQREAKPGQSQGRAKRLAVASAVGHSTRAFDAGDDDALINAATVSSWSASTHLVKQQRRRGCRGRRQQQALHHHQRIAVHLPPCRALVDIKSPSRHLACIPTSCIYTSKNSSSSSRANLNYCHQLTRIMTDCSLPGKLI